MSTSGTGWACTATGHVVTCQLSGALAVGATSAVKLVATVSPEAAPGVENTVTVTSDATETDPSNNIATDPTKVTPVADVSVVKRLAGAVVTGEQATYTLDVANAGPSSATAVVVTDTLPVGLTAVGATGAGWTCQVTGALVSCALAAVLPAGASAAPISLVVDVTATSGTVTNTASVTATELDPAPADNHSTVAAPVTQPPPPPVPDQPDGSGSGGDLPGTGTDPAPLLLLAALLIAVGAAGVAVRRGVRR